MKKLYAFVITVVVLYTLVVVWATGMNFSQWYGMITALVPAATVGAYYGSQNRP